MELDAIGVARGREVRARERGELGDPLDRVHLRGELGEDRGLIAGAGADVEHALRPAERELLADERDHVGLRDRLAGAERERAVGIRLAPQLLRHEELARHARHRLEHRLVGDSPAAELALDHPFAGLARLNRHAALRSGRARQARPR